MGHRTAAEGHSILTVAPFGRDAESVTHALRREGYDARACRNLAAVASALDEHVGVILLTEEALRDDDVQLREALSTQPPWSDVPIIFLAAKRSQASRVAEAARIHLLSYATNVIVLERPLSLNSLVSAAASAMRSRQKQFEMRDRLAERDRARSELVESEQRLRLASDNAEIGYWDVDPINDTLFWTSRVKAMFGVAQDAAVSMADFYGGVHPEDQAETFAAYAAATDPARRELYDVDYRTVSPSDGAVRWVAAKGRGLFDADGVCVRVTGTAIDITDRKAVELSLRSLNETLEQRVEQRTELLMRTEAALRQSQKMESIGQLTGGIAHDFNNMLTGVIGALDIMKRRIATGRLDDLDRFMDAAATSAQRAAALTARLLAFSRRQSLDARPIDTAALLGSLEEMLRRTISETIRLHIVPDADLLPAVADAHQLENAIVNLAINARDAMPDGGDLTIETRQVELDEAYTATHPDIAPGRYVVVDVSDTGVGIAPELVEKVFEPFFTTKPIGQGTGLGLSMIYGFARQSGGQVRVHSRQGVGTAVSIYLPAADAAAEEEQAVADAATPEGAGQIVLLVEDDPSVRLLVRELLEELSYTVIEAEEAPAAIPILTSDRPIELMVSDVGLPGMNGRQLAEVARQHRPDLPILFVTGYAENAAIRAGFLGTNMAMITKPFALDDLAAKVADMLPGSRPADAPDAASQIVGEHSAA